MAPNSPCYISRQKNHAQRKKVLHKVKDTQRTHARTTEGSNCCDGRPLSVEGRTQGLGRGGRGGRAWRAGQGGLSSPERGQGGRPHKVRDGGTTWGPDATVPRDGAQRWRLMHLPVALHLQHPCNESINQSIIHSIKCKTRQCTRWLQLGEMGWERGRGMVLLTGFVLQDDGR